MIETNSGVNLSGEIGSILGRGRDVDFVTVSFEFLGGGDISGDDCVTAFEFAGGFFGEGESLKSHGDDALKPVSPLATSLQKSCFR